MSDKKIEVKKRNMNKDNEDIKERRELILRRKNPTSLFQSMDQIFNDLKRNFFNEWYYPCNRSISPTLSILEINKEPIFRTPLANIIEDDINFKITTELPGLNKGDIEISLLDDNLEIKGETKEKKQEGKEGELVRREYRSSKYYRCFKLPENMDEENMDAILENGVLTINIPKKEISKKEKKKIHIK